MATLQKNGVRLEERLALHRLWIERAPGGVRADLSGATLTDLQLAGSDTAGDHVYRQ